MAEGRVETDPLSCGSVFIGNLSPLTFHGVNLAPLPRAAPLQRKSRPTSPRRTSSVSRLFDPRAARRSASLGFRACQVHYTE